MIAYSKKFERAEKSRKWLAALIALGLHMAIAAAIVYQSKRPTVPPTDAEHPQAKQVNAIP